MSFDGLHAPLLPILRHALAAAPLARSGIVLDLGCGAGEKQPLIRASLGPEVRLLGLDADRRLVADDGPQTADHGPRATDDRPPHLIADAHALPLADASLDAAVCIAALGLFADAPLALRELRRALRPGARALVVTAERRWAQVARWPPELAARLAGSLEGWGGPGAAPDVGGELEELLRAAGFGAAKVRGFLLGDAPHPAQLELPLVPWPALRPLAARRLTPAEIAACDASAANPELELVSVALAALARA